MTTIYSFSQLFEPVENEGNIQRIGDMLTRRRYRNFHHEEVQKMAKLFVTGHIDRWLSTPAKVRSRYAQCHDFLAQIDFVFVVTGRSGLASCHLLKLSSTIEQAQHDVGTEVLKGYSIIFTGDILKEDARKLFDQRAFNAKGFRLEKVFYHSWAPRVDSSEAIINSLGGNIISALREARVTEDGEDGRLLEIGILC